MPERRRRSAPYRAYRAVRAALETVPPVRAAIQYAVEIKNTLVDGRRSEPEALDQLFDAEDPYGFERPEEKVRFDRALEMLDAARGGARFRRAFEIGCAEGKFTAMMAPRCERLLAVDISRQAVARAAQRCAGLPGVEFGVWNMRYEPPPGSFDLIIAVGVVEYIHRPATIEQVREAMFAALDPGGYLLLGTTVSPTEDSWLGRKLLRGTHINRRFERHPGVELVSRSLDECALPFEHVLLRKR